MNDASKALHRRTGSDGPLMHGCAAVTARVARESHVAARIEAALAAALGRARTGNGPRQLAAALDYAVMPGGARIRPRLCLAVAQACGDARPGLADAAAAAIELIHCASLVHDDLPCFDDADQRRGKAALHRVYGQAIAVLAGDALIAMAFDVLGRSASEDPVIAGGMTVNLAWATGMPAGLCAGQGWESESVIDLDAYHRAKTASLFSAATRMGALAAGADPDPWDMVGAEIGAAFQIADDLRDHFCDPAEMGKPAGQDKLRGRPNVVASEGAAGAIRCFSALIEAAIAAIPPCPGKDQLSALVREQASLLTPFSKGGRTSHATGEM